MFRALLCMIFGHEWRGEGATMMGRYHYLKCSRCGHTEEIVTGYPYR